MHSYPCARSLATHLATESSGRISIQSLADLNILNSAAACASLRLQEIVTANGVCLRVEYAGRSRKYEILFIFSLFCEYINFEYVQVPVIYRVYQAEYAIHIRVAASQEYVNTYSTRRVVWRMGMAYKGGVGGRAYIAQWSCNSIAIG